MYKRCKSLAAGLALVSALAFSGAAYAGNQYNPAVCVESSQLTTPGNIDNNQTYWWQGGQVYTIGTPSGSETRQMYLASSIQALDAPNATPGTEAFATPQILDVGAGCLAGEGDQIPTGLCGEGDVWAEDVFADPNGTTSLYMLWHNEPFTVSGGQLRCDNGECCLGRQPTDYIRAVPRIGLAKSDDGGVHWTNLGLVIRPETYLADCTDGLGGSNRDSQNAGGMGDPSMECDFAKSDYCFGTVSSYQGHDPAHQGVVLFRIKKTDLPSPRGHVQVYTSQGWVDGLHAAANTLLPIPGLANSQDMYRQCAHGSCQYTHPWGGAISFNTVSQTLVITTANSSDNEWYTLNPPFVSFYLGSDPATDADPSNWQTSTLNVPNWNYSSGIYWYYTLVGMDASNLETNKVMGAHARLFMRQPSGTPTPALSNYSVYFAPPGQSASCP